MDQWPEPAFHLETKISSPFFSKISTSQQYDNAVKKNKVNGVL